jgi:hypothetical protein
MSSIALARSRSLALSRLTFPAWTVGAFICLIGAVAVLRPPFDPDLGWHLRTGQLILETHKVPTADPFSLTVPGAAWVEQEWLWQVAAAAIDSLGGWRGLALANGLLVAVTLWLVYQRLRTRRVAPLYAALGVGLALANLIPSDDVRPAMSIVLFSSVALLLLERYERSRYWPELLLVIPLQVLWANMHGSYVLGLFFCAVYGAAAFWQRLSWRSLLPWGPLFVSLLGASLANPQGAGLLRFTFSASQMSFNRHYLAEWRAPNFALADFLPLLVTLVGSLALGCLCRNWPRNEAQILLLLGCTVLVLQSNQFIVLYAVAAAPVAAEMLYRIVRAPAQAEISGLSLAILAAAAVGIVVTFPSRHLATDAYNNALEQRYPSEAVAFIQRHDLAGPVFNDYDWGGYLIQTVPQLPVFVDGRSEVYGNAFLGRYMDVLEAAAIPDPMLDRYGVNLVLIKPDRPLATELSQNPKWNEAYRDGTAVVFVRAGSG